MKTYKVDMELSKELYKKCKSYINTKECYRNVCRIYIREMMCKKEYVDYRIAYGGWQVIGCNKTLFAKHCFFIKGDKIIDPTLFTSYRERDEDMLYIVADTFSLEEYAELIELHGFETHVQTMTDKVLNTFAQELLKEQEQIFLIG